MGLTEQAAKSAATSDKLTPSFYRGEQPLLKTFVLLGIVVAFFLQLFTFNLANAVTNLAGPPWGGVFLFAIVLPYLWFASVSIWRSASRSGSLLAEILVKALVVFWLTPWILAFLYALWTEVTTGSFD